MLALWNYFPPFTFVIIIVWCQLLLQMSHCGTMTVVKRLIQAGHPAHNQYWAFALKMDLLS